MNTATMYSEQVRPLVDAQGPFASIYFDDSHDTQDASARLDVKWRDLHRELEDQGADAALIAHLERAVLDARPPVGRSGHGVIAGARGVLVDEHLILPPVTTVVRVSELPYVVPLVEYGPVHTTYLVVAVDHVGADITLYRGNTVRSETVDAGGVPVHKSPAADVRALGQQQHRVNEAIRKNIRAAADRLTTEFDHDEVEVIFVVGPDRSRADLISEMPERVAARVVEPRVGARNTGIDHEVRHAIGLEFQQRRLAVIGDTAERFRAEEGRRSGLAVEGLAAVCAALRDGAVASLIIGDLADETVLAGDEPTMLAMDPDVLSGLGAASTRTLRADEALPIAALAIDASLVHADVRLDPADGIAALLRYAPTTS